MGHMNVQYYVAAFDQAMWNLVYALGWRPPPEPSKIGFADVRHAIEYRAELRVGTPFVVDSVPLRAGRSSIVTAHRMYELASGELAAEMEMTSVHFDLERRMSMALPSEFQAVIQQAAGWPDATAGAF